MQLVKWDPFSNFEKFFENDDLFSLVPMAKLNKDIAVDVFEENGNVVAELSMPGIDPKLVEVTVENDFLKIHGQREEEKKLEEKNYFYKEIKRGSFDRVIKLPVEVKGEKAIAAYKDGILKVTIPKKEEIKANKIKISVQ